MMKSKAKKIVTRHGAVYLMFAVIFYMSVKSATPWSYGTAGLIVGLAFSDLADWNTKRHFLKKYGYRQKWVKADKRR